MSAHIPEPWPPPPPPPVQQWRPVTPGRGLHIAALVVGIVGAVAGLIPLLFLVAWGGGVVAVVLGAIAYRQGRTVGVRQGRAGIILGAVALALGTLGLAIVNSAFDDLDRELNPYTTTTWNP
jgi:hypothetical protein